MLVSAIADKTALSQADAQDIANRVQAQYEQAKAKLDAKVAEAKAEAIAKKEGRNSCEYALDPAEQEKEMAELENGGAAAIRVRYVADSDWGSTGASPHRKKHEGDSLCGGALAFARKVVPDR